MHLATIKKFNERFLDLALNPPIDTNLRPPSLQEILQADRAVWASIFELTSDHGWSLPDALNETAFCRGEMANLLQPRPRPPRTSAHDAAPSKAAATSQGVGPFLVQNDWGQGSYAIGKCTKSDCKFVHGCPVPLPNGKACGQPHTALDHGKTPH